MLIKGGETIRLNTAGLASNHKPYPLALQVHWEDEHLAVVEKPAGILVSGNTHRTIVNALPENLKPSSEPDVTAPQPVHRLDFATTGLLLVAKTRSSLRVLSQQFQEKQVQKTYNAIAIGSMEPSGTIDYPIDDKPAQTDFKVVKTVASPRFGSLNLVRLTPWTGRRHQIRKHLAEAGNPILGDKDYGKEGLILQGKGLYLHAYSLSFTHPKTREVISLKSELPKRFWKIFPDLHQSLGD